MTRILILDDFNFTRQALKTILEKEEDLEIIGQANNATQALEYLERIEVDIVIADIEMPEVSGITMTKIVTQQFPDVKVIIFTSHDDEQNINAAIEAGAKGYISKNTSTTILVEVIRNVRQGYFQLGPGIFEKSLAAVIRQQQSSLAYLSQIEEKCAQLDKRDREEIFNELYFQLDNLKTELREGLNIFQNRVNHQVQIGLDEFSKSSDRLNLLSEIKKQIGIQNSEYQIYLRNLFVSTKSSVEKLEQQVSFIRYLVIFLGIAFFAEHLAGFFWR
ncbi:response regulator transcription factor [Myxosarcina sp. GI1]|uniref:response regulator n=1 Tax=Myxosarcina sp. GI1 TaxID=1541065 RepID=UPI000565FC59|nr:response regulator [Myxosarcina sp. GI1]